MTTKTSGHMVLALCAALAMAAVGGCDRGDQPATLPAAANGPAGGAAAADEAGAPGRAGAAVRDACPTEAEIAAVVGTPVKRLKGFGCSYQSEDGNTDVSILIAAASQGDQLLQEMRETAQSRPDAQVEPVAVAGERAHLYGTRGQATAVAVAGGKAYWVDISSPGGSDTDRKPQVLQILKMLMR